MAREKIGNPARGRPARINQHEIRIRAHRDRTFPSGQTEPPSHGGTGEMRDLRWIEPDAEERGQELLRTHDPSPHGKEIIALLPRWRARRVVSADRIHVTAKHATDHVRARGIAAQRRRTFGRGADSLHVLRGEE